MSFTERIEARNAELEKERQELAERERAELVAASVAKELQQKKADEIRHDPRWKKLKEAANDPELHESLTMLGQKYGNRVVTTKKGIINRLVRKESVQFEIIPSEIPVLSFPYELEGQEDNYPIGAIHMELLLEPAPYSKTLCILFTWRSRATQSRSFGGGDRRLGLDRQAGLAIEILSRPEYLRYLQGEEHDNPSRVFYTVDDLLNYLVGVYQGLERFPYTECIEEYTFNINWPPGS